MEKYKLALPYLETIVKDKPDEVPMWELLGQVYANLNDMKKRTKRIKADLIREGKNKKENMSQQPPQQINIELGEKEAEGIYSNLAIITHSPAEFVIDFTRILPGVPKSKVLPE